MIYFKPLPKTLEELKRLYRQLSFKHHPDVGGSEDAMKIINSEYTELFNELKDIHAGTDGSTFRRETKETPEQMIVLMNRYFKAQKWVDSAQEDYCEAECVLQGMDEGEYDVLWQLCNEAAKKFIISLLVFKNIRVPQGCDLPELVNVCETQAKINLSYIYKECSDLADEDIQEDEYSGYYVEGYGAKQVLKKTEKIDYFVTSYFHEILSGSSKEKPRLENRRYLPGKE